MMQEQKIIRNKIGLLKLAQTLDSVSEACKVIGYSGVRCPPGADPRRDVYE